jgi:hypothetical protein
MPDNSALLALVGTPLFNRQLSLTIGYPLNPKQNITVPFTADSSRGIDISGFDVDFNVEKSTKPGEPNNVHLRVYNLAPTTRQAISGAQKLTVRLEAGYLGAVAQLYFAEARAAWTTAEGPDYITTIESTDTIARPTGVHSTTKAQPGGASGNIYRTTGAYVPLQQAFQAIVQQMGVGKGNLDQALAQLQSKGFTSVPGGALIGNTARRMTDLCRSAGLQWWIDDGALVLVNAGQALQTTKAIRISEESGMIGSPSVDSQGALSVKTLLIPGLAPGVLISVDSLFVNGGYRIEKIKYIGSTYGKDWLAEIQAVKY